MQELPEAPADNPADAQMAPVAAPLEPSDPAQTLGVPSDERRESQRRAEPPEGIPVRVGLGGAPADQGRRSEDRVEPPPEPSEPVEEDSVDSAAEDSAEPEPIEREAVDDPLIPPWESPTAPARPRRAAPPSRRTVALGALLVAFAAVAIPVIRSILSEPHRAAAIEPPAESRKAREAIEPAGPAEREAIVEIPAAARAANLPIDEPPAVEPPRAEAIGPFAVQINASPWANVEVDGIDLGATPLANIPLFAGAHSFRARMPDGRVIERTVEIDAEQRFISFE